MMISRLFAAVVIWQTATAAFSAATITNCDSSTVVCPLSYTERALVPGESQLFDSLGMAAAMDGDTCVFGAPTDSSEGQPGPGAAYVFVRNENGWIEQAKLLPDDGQAFDEFGFSAAISTNTIVVGSILENLEVGSAYVFSRNGTNWTEEAKLSTAGIDRELGYSVVSDEFGYSVAVEGDTIVIGSPLEYGYFLDEAGAAYVYQRNGTNWTRQARLMAGDLPTPQPPVPIYIGAQFGYSVAIQGGTIVIGADRDDTPAGQDAGSVYVFVRNGTNWVQQAKITASDAKANDQFGQSVAIEADTIVVGAQNAYPGATTNWGSAYVFNRSGTNWIQQAKLTSCDRPQGDGFGFSVAVSGESILVGAFWDDTSAGTNAGSAHLFLKRGSTWIERARIEASGALPNDWYGFSLALKNNTAVVGAPRQFGAAPYDRGVGYVLDLDPPTQSVVCELSPSFATNLFGSVQTLTAGVGSNCVPISNVNLNFRIISGPHSGRSYSQATDANGQAEFVYSSDGNMGTDIIEATGTVGAQSFTGLASIVWLPTNQPPVAMCHSISTNLTAGCELYLTPAHIDDGSFDPDGSGLLLQLSTEGPFTVGTNQVTLTVRDERGSSDSCSSLVIVGDGLPPTINCQSNVTVIALRGYPAASYTYYTPAASDNCGVLSVNCEPDTSVFPIGTNTVTCTAVDLSGNTNVCQFLVIARENLPSVPDLGVLRITAPRRVRLSDKAPSRKRSVAVQIQSYSLFPEVIGTTDTLASFINLAAETLGNCDSPVPVISEKTARLLPRTLKPRRKFTVHYDITYSCANDPAQGMEHEDYRYTVSLNRSALDGFADENGCNDLCPRSSCGGCGGRNPNGTLGADVLTDVVKR